MIILDHLFAKYVFSGYDDGYDFFQGHFGHFWGPGRVFFQGLGQFSELGGGFPDWGGDSLFLIAALYWMFRD